MEVKNDKGNIKRANEVKRIWANELFKTLLHNPRNFIVKMGWKFEIPRLHPVVHLHYLEHFGASGYKCLTHFSLIVIFV